MMLQRLKTNWERYQNQIDLSDNTIKSLIKNYKQTSIQSINLLTNGCANSNYKITFSDNSQCVLRLYLREDSALHREYEISQRYRNIIPIPEFYYIDPSCTHIDKCLAIIEYCEGELMRDIILRGNDKDIVDCTYAAGKLLAKLSTITFEEGGFFENDFTIRPFTQDEKYYNNALKMLAENSVIEALGITLHKQLLQLVESNQHYFPNVSTANLVHADFDPTNILVKKRKGRYEISSLIDWEFAYAGSYLMDIGEFLRYSHRLLSTYQENFIRGMENSGLAVPKQSLRSAKLVDLVCLFHLLYWNPVSSRPNLHKDVMSLILDTAKLFQTSQD